MNSATTTRALLALATVFGGIVAGFSVNRGLIDLKAWNAVGAADWARFTRQADLSAGLVLYPAEGLAALVTTMAAAVAFHFDRIAPRSAAVPVHAAAILALTAFMVTRFIMAPDTLRLRDPNLASNDLAQALQHMRVWWGPKATLHLVTFVCNVWSLLAIAR